MFLTYSVIKGNLQISKANPNYTLHSIHFNASYNGKYD